MSAEPGRKAPYSADLRWRMVWQRFGLELTYKEIAKRLNVAISTVYGTCNRFEDTGNVDPTIQPARLHCRKLDDSHGQLVLSIIMEYPSVYLHELCKYIFNASGVTVSEATVCRLLRHHGLTRKKVRQVALQRSMGLRSQFMAQVLSFPSELLVWLDETGCDARNYMRSLTSYEG